jgi:hypothetical protein
MFSLNSWVKVWKIQTQDKYTRIQCSTQQKKDGKYTTDFSGYATLVGEAHKKAVNIAERDSIKITNFGLTSSSSNGKYYTNIIVFDFETNDAKDGADDDLPFN